MQYILLFVLFPLAINGQIPIREHVEPELFNSQNNLLIIEKVIPVPEKGVVIYKVDNVEQPNKVEVSFYDMNLQLVSTRAISTSRTNELFAIENIFIWNNALVFLASLYYPGPKKNHLLFYQYNLPALELIQSKLILETIAPTDVYIPYFSKLSTDKSKLLVLGWNYTQPKANAHIKFKILDSQLKETREQQYKFEYQNQKIALEDLFLDDNGTVFLTGNNYRGDPDFKIKVTQLDHFVVGFYPDLSSKIWSIKTGEYNFQRVQYSLNPNSELIGLGFWSRMVKGGTGFIKINPISKALTFKTVPIENKTFKGAQLRFGTPKFTRNLNFL